MSILLVWGEYREDKVGCLNMLNPNRIPLAHIRVT